MVDRRQTAGLLPHECHYRQGPESWPSHRWTVRLERLYEHRAFEFAVDGRGRGWVRGSGFTMRKTSKKAWV